MFDVTFTKEVKFNLFDVYDCDDDQCDVYVNTLILCEVHVEVVQKSALLFQKISLSETQTKPLTTKIYEMCNKI